jgi:hypothetical protein
VREQTSEVEDVARELVPLRNAIRAELEARPIVLTADGLDDLVSRLTVRVAQYVGRTVGPTEPKNARPRKLDPDEPCPGCGALPQRGRHGVARLHSAECSHVGSLAPKH